MKKILSLIMCLFLLGLIPSVNSVSTGSWQNVTAGTANTPPQLTLVASGAYTDTSLTTPVSHTGNYAFTGDILYFQVDVRDNDGNQDIKDVQGTVGGSTQVNCQEEAVIDLVTKRYQCFLAVEFPDSMQGQYDVTVRAIDKSNQIGTLTPAQSWWLNPFISLGITGSIDFPVGSAGDTVTTSPLTITNNAEGGVTMRMKLSGKDMGAIGSGYALCPTSNVLELSNIDYYAASGAFNTGGYLSIPYETGSPSARADIIPSQPLLLAGNDISITFRLTYPTPCTGSFGGEAIYLWGEAL